MKTGLINLLMAVSLFINTVHANQSNNLNSVDSSKTETNSPEKKQFTYDELMNFYYIGSTITAINYQVQFGKETRGIDKQESYILARCAFAFEYTGWLITKNFDDERSGEVGYQFMNLGGSLVASMNLESLEILVPYLNYWSKKYGLFSPYEIDTHEFLMQEVQHCDGKLNDEGLEKHVRKGNRYYNRLDSDFSNIVLDYDYLRKLKGIDKIREKTE